MAANGRLDFVLEEVFCDRWRKGEAKIRSRIARLVLYCLNRVPQIVEFAAELPVAGAVQLFEQNF